jgi:2-methylisocitrate lyase-like PEP mutase family enzyme
VRDLAADAMRLRELHGGPLLLANAWDVATARLTEELGFPAVATSSAAVAAVLGGADADSLEPNDVFGAIASIAAAVSVPVTADVEAGYALPPTELAGRILAAGAVGCNLEDSDHHGEDVLVDPDAHAERISGLKEASRSNGVDLVVNARIDTYVRGIGDADEQLAETLRRGRLYRAAGADCVYPIGVVDPAHISALVDELGTVNVLLRPGTPSISSLTELGVARISVGSGLFNLAMEDVRRAATGLLTGHEWWNVWP